MHDDGTGGAGEVPIYLHPTKGLGQRERKDRSWNWKTVSSCWAVFGEERE